MLVYKSTLSYQTVKIVALNRSTRMEKLYPEAEVVSGCQTKDPHYQQILYKQYYKKMYGVCLRYTDNEADAMDILQEGFIKVFQQIAKFEGRGSLEGWIRRIMIHQAIQHYRKQSRYLMVNFENADIIEDKTCIVSSLSQAEILSYIQALPVGYRTIFNLYVVEGYTHEEIAKKLNIAPGTSKSQLARAKQFLRKRINHSNKKCSA